MNRRTFLITAVVGLLLVGGAGFGYYSMKMNDPAFRGRAIPVKGLNDEIIDTWEAAFKEALSRDEVLKRIVEKSDYAEMLSVPAGEAVDHLREAVKVRYKKRKDTIEVGLVGKRKHDDQLKTIAQVLYQEAEIEIVTIAPSFQEYLDAVLQNR